MGSVTVRLDDKIIKEFSGGYQREKVELFIQDTKQLRNLINDKLGKDKICLLR